MNKKLVTALGLALTAAMPLWADNIITLTVDGKTVEMNPIQITFDGDNATLVFDNQETSTVDMALVNIAFQYDREATVIRNIQAEDNARPEAVYNLNGQRITLQSAQGRKGIYIINNKKVIR
ncbi:MAG: hypothetical protein ACI4BA_09005 [Prevotella sp.]